MIEAEEVIMFDTTLRDGKQTIGVKYDPEDVVPVADAIASAGADVIEAGFPSNNNDFEGVQAVADEVGNKLYLVRGVERTPVICGLALATEASIERCWEAIEGAEYPRIHAFMATSKLHREVKFEDMSEEAQIAHIKNSVARARELSDDVQFSPEVASQTDFDYMLITVLAAVEAGATTVNIPDTNGVMMPYEYGEMIRKVRDAIDDPSVVVSVHCHNDLGMAIANSIEGVRVGGARQVEGTFNGEGERAGNAQISAVAAVIEERGTEWGVHTNMVTERFQDTARFVARASGLAIPVTQPVIGRNPWGHESGVHAAAVRRNIKTYGALDPGKYGAEVFIAEGSTNGRHARDLLDERGVVSEEFGGAKVAVIK